ncbi:MAG: FAD binding domain-containing protein [Treponema sp.]|nr:FAD binding domain-containing protein [Treponema sp.]
MTVRYSINGKKNIESSSVENLQNVLRKNGCTSVKLGCSKGFCGNCMVLLNDVPIPSCKLSFASIKDDDEIVTLSYFQKAYPEAKDIARGFEKAGINLCGYCDAGKFFTAYDLIKNGKPSEEEVRNAINGLNTCCTDSETLYNGIMYAYEINSTRKAKELNYSKSRKNPLASPQNEPSQIPDSLKQTVDSEMQAEEENDENEKIIFPSSIQKLFAAIGSCKDFYISNGGTYENHEEESIDIENIENIESKAHKHNITISLKKIQELKSIERHERYIEIGSAVTLNELLNYPRIPQVLCDSIKGIGSHAMRNLSTIGGNICIPEHKGSTWAALLALDAKFEIASSNEAKKIVKAYEFKSLSQNEILTKIRIPINNWNISFYKRLGSENFLTGKTAGFCFLAETERDHIYNISIAFSGIGELSHHDEIFRHRKKSFHKRLKYGFISDLIGQKLPLQERLINSCIANAGKIFSEKFSSSSEPIIEQQFKALLKSVLEKLA